jgi:hypothetical protein
MTARSRLREATQKDVIPSKHAKRHEAELVAAHLCDGIGGVDWPCARLLAEWPETKANPPT